MKVRMLVLLVALMLPSLVLAEGWYGSADKESELGRKPFSVERSPKFDDIKFRSGNASVDRRFYSTLDKTYQALKKDPHLRVSLQGYSDNAGSEEENMRLSKNRAHAVEDYLTRRGVSHHRVEVGWHGSYMPIAPNVSARGRAENNRVTVTLYRRDILLELPKDLGIIE